MSSEIHVALLDMRMLCARCHHQKRPKAKPVMPMAMMKSEVPSGPRIMLEGVAGVTMVSTKDESLKVSPTFCTGLLLISTVPTKSESIAATNILRNMKLKKGKGGGR